ncbi:palmitoyltransferase ZDHHC18 [Sarcoptes scabiei]|nr:palmitoyltransferase ZDHHC18 [Sarcoptes scabiei]
METRKNFGRIWLEQIQSKMMLINTHLNQTTATFLQQRINYRQKGDSRQDHRKRSRDNLNRSTRKYSILQQSSKDFQFVLDQIEMPAIFSFQPNLPSFSPTKSISYDQLILSSSTISSSLSSSSTSISTRIYDKYQMAIYELFNAELNIYCRINKLIYIYQKPMLSYRLINENESRTLFYDLDGLAKIHRQFIKNLVHQQTNGIFRCPIEILREFFRTLDSYQNYCLNLSESKKLLLKKMQQKSFVNFLHSEQVWQFGEKLDLTSHLDQPRRHLMKYPLMLAEIQRYAIDSDEIQQLRLLRDDIDRFIQEIEKQISIEKCSALLDRFDYSLKGSISKEWIQSNCSRLIMALEVQKSLKRWPKNHLILFDRVLILARCSVTLWKKFRILSMIPTGCDLYYSISRRNPKQKLRNVWRRRGGKERRKRRRRRNQSFDSISSVMIPGQRRKRTLSNSRIASRTVTINDDHSKNAKINKWLRLQSINHSPKQDLLIDENSESLRIDLNDEKNSFFTTKSLIASTATLNCDRCEIVVKFINNNDLYVCLRKLRQYFNLIAR